MKNKALRIASVISSLMLLTLFVLYKAGTFSLLSADNDAEPVAHDDARSTESEGVSWAEVTNNEDEMMGGSKSVVIELNDSADLLVTPDSLSGAHK